jgi:hypothetical protein
LNYIVLAIPVFFLLILLELVITRLLEKDYYRLSDSISDLGCGIVQQLLEVFVKTALFAGYLLLYRRYRVFDVPGSAAWAWVACFGRTLTGSTRSHEVNAFWAAHVVHHRARSTTWPWPCAGGVPGASPGPTCRSRSSLPLMFLTLVR